MSEQRSPRVGDEVEVRIPRATVTSAPDEMDWVWVKVDGAGAPSRVRAEHCSVLSLPPQPGEHIETVERLAECVDGTVFAPEAPIPAIFYRLSGLWFGTDGTATPVIPGRVLAVRGEQR
jgi:hypothetical protein